ncbi:MAG: adenylate/guanylate cyclase domain-containing protein [Burkholderiales bacterium]|jgi:class 3 adenylate cyclase
MNSFQRRTAIRIAGVSIVLASIASPVAWFVARERSEESIVSLAIEESRGLIEHLNAADLSGPDAVQHATIAAKTISGGLFDIAEIYDSSGRKLAEAMTAEGAAVESSLPHHGKPGYTVASYHSFGVPGKRWILRTFVPLRSSTADTSGPVTGYFEGVRVVPAWQEEQLFSSSLTAALMVCLASLLCGAALYPVVVRLSADNERKARELLESQAALIEVLQRSEHELEDKVSQRTLELQQEQIRTKELLHNILPVEIAEELSATGSARPARHESVTILFTDFSGFTQAVSAMPADRMVGELNEIFAAFDLITDECGVEKIKTVGDAYMAAAGLPKACADHAQRCVRAALRMVDYLEQRNRSAPFKWSLRLGVHSGPVVAGVVGKRKYAYDIWGDTVNIASRMESSGEIGRVNISAYTYDLVRGEFDCEYRGKVDAKGKGQIDMYFVKGPRPA